MAGIGTVYFTVELLIAELLLLFSYPKRKHFLVRYFVAIIVCILLSYFFPEITTWIMNPFYQLAKYIILFLYTVFGMYFCFDIPLTIMISACAGGYAIQHLSYHATSLLSLTGLLSNFVSPVSFISKRNLLEFILFPISYCICYFCFGRLSKKYKCYKNNNSKINILSVLIIFICIGLTRFSKYFSESLSITVCLYSITCCILALIIQFNLYHMISVLDENNAVKLLLTEEKKQYELSKKNIELINVKCHDLRHQLSYLNNEIPKDEIESIKNSINIYDSNFKTGNEVLDVLLTENSMRYHSENIQLTFLGDGKVLSFMEAYDVYSLFSNAIENSYEAVKNISNPDKKVISISIETKGDLISINISNYYDGEITYTDGLPQTIKKEEIGFHGYGVKSIRLICQKYNGIFNISSENHIFSLSLNFLK